MKKRYRLVAMLLALLLCFAACATAELRRGDSGDEVYALQELLFEAGWLFEVPDGAFGKNTEQAVKDYENYAQLPVDGIADDEMMARLEADWYALMVEIGQIDPDEAAPQGGEESAGYPSFCTHSNAEGCGSAVSYCEAHAEINAQANALLESGSAEDAHRAYALWRGEIIRLYDTWFECAPEGAKADIVTSRTLLLSAMEAKLRAVRSYYESFQIDPGEAQAIAAVMQELCGHAAWLCAMISGSLAVNEGGLER